MTSRSFCCDPNSSATLHYRSVKHKHLFWECVYEHSIYLFSSYITAVSSMIEVSWEERVYYLLQLSALFAVLCRSSTGLPLNAIRLRLWLFAFLIIAGMLFEACDKRSTTPPHSGVACTHSSTAVHSQTRTQTCKTYTNPVWVVVSLTTCANQSVESNLSGNL